MLLASSISGRPHSKILVVARHLLSTVGRRAFTVQGLVVWNSLPDDLRAHQDPVVKVQNYRRGNAAFMFWPLTMVVCLSLAL